MSRLPDDALLRTDGAVRTNAYGDKIFVAVSAWSTQEEAHRAAKTFRAGGRMSRAVQTARPVRTIPPRDRLQYSERLRRHMLTKTRWMWVVFAERPHSTEISAYAGEKEGPPG